MGETPTLLVATAASIGVLHTLMGPDHYLPFVVMGRASGWTRRKTLLVTLGCGAGHVASSVGIGALGIAAGVAVARLEAVEGGRGHAATLALIAFGLVYLLWGVRRALRNRPHAHVHAHVTAGGATVHLHQHDHQGDHLHAHPTADPEQHAARRITPWVLFTIFLLGPCEPLIPLLMVPAARGGIGAVVVVVAVFGLATLLTMALAVLALDAGLGRLPGARSGRWAAERWSHAAAGAALLSCGLAMLLLGL